MTSASDDQPAGAERRRRYLIFAAAYMGTWLALWSASSLVEQVSHVSLWFLPAGLRFACLLFFGWRGLLLEVATSGMLLLLYLLFSSWPFQPDTFFYNLLVYAGAQALIVLPLRRLMRDGFDFSHAGHAFLFLGAAVAAAALTGLAGAFYMNYTGAIDAVPWRITWANWMLGDFVGIITVVPLLQVHVWPRLKAYLAPGSAAKLPAVGGAVAAGPQRSGLQVVTIVVLALFVVLFIAREATQVEYFPIVALLLLLPLAAVTMRFGLSGAVLAVALLDMGMVIMIALLQQRELALQYQLVMIAIVLVGLWLGGAIEARNRVMKRYQDFAGVSNDLLWEVDAAGRLATLNGRLARLVARYRGQPWQTLVEGASPTQVATLEKNMASQRTFLHLDIELRRGDAAPRWIQLSGLPVMDDMGVVVGYRGTARDVSRAYRARRLLRSYNEALQAEVARQVQELRRSHDELALKEQHLNLMFSAAPVGVMELDAAARCTYLNSHGVVLTGWPVAEVLGQPLLDLVHARDREAVAAALATRNESQEVQQFEFRMDRTGIWCSAHLSRLPPTESSAGRTLVVITDVTSKHRQAALLWQQAHHDPLTGLPNRALFWDRCGQAVSLAKRQGTIAAFCWIDLDDFKPVNDRLGHAAGDALLQQVAQRMKARLRESDTLARIGGDEFAVVMPDVQNLAHAVRVAGELKASLADEFHLSQGHATVSCSVGVALFPEHAEDPQVLAQCADAALYKAKSQGKGSIQVWRPGG